MAGTGRQLEPQKYQKAQEKHISQFQVKYFTLKMSYKKQRQSTVSVLTVDANMDPPNQTAYRCMWCVMTCTSMGLGYNTQTLKRSQTSVLH